MLRFAEREYYGTRAFERRAAGLSFSYLQATIPEHEVREHSHESMHLVLATRGVYQTSARGEQREGPVLVFNPPEVVHRDCFCGDDGWFFAIHVAQDQIALLHEEIQLPDYAQRIYQPMILKLALNLMRTASSPDCSGLDLELLTTNLLLHLLPPTPLSTKPPPWLKQAQEMMADVSEQDLSVADIADALGVHRVYLARQYVRHLGCRPGDELRRRRVERATQMIMSGRGTLTEIAFACGFCDQSHMNRAFAKQWGMSPLSLAKLLDLPERRLDGLRQSTNTILNSKLTT